MLIIIKMLINMIGKAKMLAIMKRFNDSDPEIHSNPKCARHCRTKHALPHVQVSSENTINKCHCMLIDIGSNGLFLILPTSQQHIAADELCRLRNLVFHWSCGNCPFWETQIFSLDGHLGVPEKHVFSTASGALVVGGVRDIYI